MTRLRASDLEAALEATAGWHHVETLDSLVDAALADLNRLIPSDMIAWNELDVVRGKPVRIVQGPGQVDAPPPPDDVLAHYLDQHPVVSHFARTRDGSPVKFSDFVTLRQLRRLDVYDALFRPYAADRHLALAIQFPPAVGVGVAFNRSGRDFTERDRRLLELLRPHLAVAYRIIRFRERARERIAQLEQALRDAPGAVARDAEGVPSLTARELEVMELVAHGLTNPQIATRLYVSRLTVKKHLEHVYAKLGVRSRAGAAARYVELRRDGG